MRVFDHLEQAQMAMELYGDSDAATLKVLLRRTLDVARDLTWGDLADLCEDDEGRSDKDGTY